MFLSSPKSGSSSAAAASAKLPETQNEKLGKRWVNVAIGIAAVAVVCLVFPKLIAYALGVLFAFAAYDVYKVGSTLKTINDKVSSERRAEIAFAETVLAKHVVKWLF